MILNFLRVTGPTIPSKVAKNIKEEILIASAHLSDLRSQNKLKISNLKIGGSPLYYLAGQEAQLYNFAAGNMNPKDLMVLDNLKEKKILREINLDLLSKVALRSLKDFAIPLHVTVDERTELFWKWHLLSNDETNHIISGMISGTRTPIIPTPQSEPVVETETISQQQEQQEQIIEKQQTILEAPKTELKTVEEKFNEETQQTSVTERVPIEQEEIIKEKRTVNEEKVEKVVETNKEDLSEKQLVEEEKKDSVVKKEIKEKLPEVKKEKEVIQEEKNKPEASQEEEETKKKPFFQKFKEKIIKKKRKEIADDFLPIIESFFDKMDINIDLKETIRKNSEMDFIINVPSAVGKIIYFCKAKSKNKCDEKDISAAYMQAQTKKLPLLFLYTNEINKKAEEMLESGVFENAIVRSIGNENK
jgi:hypothetical protein